MNRALRYLGSTRFTLLGMAALALGAALSYDNPAGTPAWVLVVPLAALALNLLLAMCINPRIHRQWGLLGFHLGLLGVVVLAAIGRLTYMEAHLELVTGSAFDAGELFDVRRGPWHDGGLQQLQFVQGPYTVDYRAGMVRGRTHSQVHVAGPHGQWQPQDVGDDRPLRVHGYRFYTTFNKGFAPVLTWMADGRPAVTGTVNMPAYPLFDFRQQNSWTPPGGRAIRFWLKLDTGRDDQRAWRLDVRTVSSRLIVNSDEQRIELLPGQQVRLDGGVLRYDRLAAWMGYKLFYDPTLHALFAAAVFGILGLFVHYWRTMFRQPLPGADAGEHLQ
ncbi:MAG: cytochrome c biogenesis protein ResB [Gammaproteobacteria bacterium]|nr:cytochrome c biogenesis protein ResB [Gammaproteobacteria bacterium]